MNHHKDVAWCIRALQRGAERDKEMAACTLNAMARDDELKLIITKQGGLKLLVRMLRSRNLKAKDFAIQALGNLGYNQDISVLIGRLGAIPFVLDSVKTGKDSMRKSCFFALKALAYTEETGIEIVRQGGIRLLLDEMDGRDIVGRRWAAHIFARLAYHDCIRQFLANESGIVQTLIKFLKCWAEDCHSVGLVALAICHLAYRKEHQITITEAGAIPPLVDMVSAEDIHCRRHATKGLANLSYNGLVQVAIHDAGSGVIRERLMCVKSEGHPYFEEAPPDLPGWNRMVIDTIVKQKGVAIMVDQLGDQEDDVCKRNAICALAAFACVPEHRRAIVKTGAVPRLVELLNDKDDVLIGKKAGWTLTNLMCASREAQDIAARGTAIDVLIEVLRVGDDTSKERAALAVANLAADHEANRQAVVEQGGVEALLDFMGHADNVGARNCSFALANLSVDECIAESIVESGLVPVFMRLIACEEESCVDGGLSALFNLSRHERGVECIQECDGAFAIVDLLQMKGDLRQVAIATLKNLSPSSGDS